MHNVTGQSLQISQRPEPPQNPCMSCKLGLHLCIQPPMLEAPLSPLLGPPLFLCELEGKKNALQQFEQQDVLVLWQGAGQPEDRECLLTSVQLLSSLPCPATLYRQAFEAFHLWPCTSGWVSIQKQNNLTFLVAQSVLCLERMYPT